MKDRRQDQRKVSTFRPACIEIEDTVHVALMRDISALGAGFEAPIDLKAGQRLRYRWGNEEFREAEVSWFFDGRFGVSHLADTTPNERYSPYSYRSVRVPKACEAFAYIGGEKMHAFLHNFSQRGLGMRLDRDLPVGTLATLKCGNRYLEGATVRWNREGVVGFNLPSSLNVLDMEALALAS